MRQEYIRRNGKKTFFDKSAVLNRWKSIEDKDEELFLTAGGVLVLRIGNKWMEHPPTHEFRGAR